jgi:hypothetical protein
MIRSATHGTKRAALERGVYSDFGSDDNEQANLLSKKAKTKSKSKKATLKKKKKSMLVILVEIRECTCEISDL